MEAVAYALPTRGTIVLAIEAERMVNMVVMSSECVRQGEVGDGRGSELPKGIGVEITRPSAHHGMKQSCSTATIPSPQPTLDP